MYSWGGRRKTEGLLLRALDSRAQKILAVYDREDERTLLTGGTAFEAGSGCGARGLDAGVVLSAQNQPMVH